MKQIYSKRILSIIIMMVCLSLVCNAEMPGKKKEKKITEDTGTKITLVASGTGDTKDEATKSALRNALEQTYGAFVSSNTTVLNDELVKDEIVSISNGNIIEYDILSYVDSNPKEVTVKAVISISRLQKYAQNKGMSTELAGNTFAMNMKIEEMNEQNRAKALEHLLEQARMFSSKLFDYKLIVGSPEKTSKGVEIPITINVIASQNTLTFYDMIHNTLTSICKKKKTGSDFHLYGGIGFEFKGFQQNDSYGIGYLLSDDNSNSKMHNTCFDLIAGISDEVLNCEIVDNIGNISSFKKWDYQREGHSPNTYIIAYQSNREYVTTNKLSMEEWRGSKGFVHTLIGVRENIYVDNRKKTFKNPDYAIKHNHWLNGNKPTEGETLYDINVMLHYTMDEVSKINNIEIRPGLSSVTIENINMLFSILETLKTLQKDKDKFLEALTKADKLIEEIKMSGNFPDFIKELDQNVKGGIRELRGESENITP